MEQWSRHTAADTDGITLQELCSAAVDTSNELYGGIWDMQYYGKNCQRNRWEKDFRIELIPNANKRDKILRMYGARGLGLMWRPLKESLQFPRAFEATSSSSRLLSFRRVDLAHAGSSTPVNTPVNKLTQCQHKIMTYCLLSILLQLFLLLFLLSSVISTVPWAWPGYHSIY
jgi:hypothetical protein